MIKKEAQEFQKSFKAAQAKAQAKSVVPITDPRRLWAAGQTGQTPPQTAAEIIAASDMEIDISPIEIIGE